MTCKDCFHYEACKDMYDGSREDFDGDVSAEYCEFFKNKADVVEVKHGKWQLGRRGRKLVCSQCESFMPFKKDVKQKYHITWYSAYCPNCGAKMDGGKVE